jgi:hypothetical protein
LDVTRTRDGERAQEVILTLDLNRLSKGERILGVSALLLLILSFLPLWAKLEIEGAEELGFDGTDRYSAWSAAFGFILKLGLVLAIIALVFVVIRAVGTQMNLPVPVWQIYAACAGLCLLLLLITVLTGPVGDQGDFGGFEWSRGLGIFIGPVLAAAMAYGAYAHMQAEGAAPSTGPAPGGPANPPPPAS